MRKIESGAAQYQALLLSYVAPQWRRVTALGVLLVGGIALQLANPQIVRHYLDTARAGGAAETLVGAGALYLGVAVLAQAAAVASTYLGEGIAWRSTNRLREDLTLHCLRLDPTFHSAHTPGAMIERIDGDVGFLGNFLSAFALRVAANALLLVGIVAALLVEDWRLGLAFAAFAALALVVLLAIRKIPRPHWRADREASTALFGFVEERLSGLEDTRGIGAESYALGRLRELMDEHTWRSRNAVVVGNVGGFALFVFLGLAYGIALGSGAHLVPLGAMSVGTVYLVFAYAQTIVWPVQQLAGQLQDFQRAGVTITRIGELYRTESRVTDGPVSGLAAGALSVEFDHVSFAYGADAEAILCDVSFRLAPGTVLGLLGRTGSGKTTIARLLFRFYDPTDGVVHVGGADARELELAALRRRVGLVTQDVQLFHASVRDNLTFFDADVPDARVLDVIEELGLWQWYERLPCGLDTVLAPGGGGLSAGEAQLLAFGRVFLRDPGVVVLDEASARLDPATEALVQRAVDRLLRGRTALVIAHRLATVQRADEILILENGRVREYGPRGALAALPDSRFSQLLRAGLVDEADAAVGGRAVHISTGGALA